MKMVNVDENKNVEINQCRFQVMSTKQGYISAVDAQFPTAHYVQENKHFGNVPSPMEMESPMGFFKFFPRIPRSPLSLLSYSSPSDNNGVIISPNPSSGRDDGEFNTEYIKLGRTCHEDYEEKAIVFNTSDLMQNTLEPVSEFLTGFVYGRGQRENLELKPCGNRKEGLSKCGRCKQAFYCDVECQVISPIYLTVVYGCLSYKAPGSMPLLLAHPTVALKLVDVVGVHERKEDWPMHKLECSAMCAFGQNWNPSETVRLTARILAKQKTHPERTQSEKLLAVKEFESHLDKLDNEKRELIQNDIAALHHFYSKHLEYPDNAALVVLFAQVNCNGFTIEDEELSHLGSAIFPDVALMNHSCCPNVIVTYKGTLAEVRAVKEIEPGEEVFTSYIDLLYPTEDRNDRLRDSYFFNCDCRECMTKEKDKEKLEIRKLNDPPSAETVRDMIKYARNVIEEFRRAKHYKYILCLNPDSTGLVCDLKILPPGLLQEKYYDH
ncbi:n-lysine hypothetical protein [Limosa lapponica baueri]|uniref:[histone H3]-lysine(4) N-trimethyltransferase n=1 Tax=Limosa lapponica baueri TaxID=1758121 RepID=A0A2I0USA6_LIMLA|nr:n-lysine hypothetical protein [Limosa lapponica baueri]